MNRQNLRTLTKMIKREDSDSKSKQLNAINGPHMTVVSFSKERVRSVLLP